MRNWLIAVTILLAAVPAAAQTTADEKAVLEVAQKFFDALATRDAALGNSILLPGARYYSARDNGTVTGADLAAYMEKLPAGKEKLQEQMFQPEVRIHGRAAMVWTSYDFHRDGKFSHCGVDAFTLARTPEGWKIAALLYTVEPAGCPARK